MLPYLKLFLIQNMAENPVFRIVLQAPDAPLPTEAPTEAPTQDPPQNKPETDDDDDSDDAPELPIAERLDLAHRAWIDSNGELKIRKAACTFGVTYSTLYGRIHGAIPKVQANQSMQRLCIAEEEAIQDWLNIIDGWGWPLRIDRLRAMTSELLIAKG